ncbi:hypothetical protein GCM10011611_48220 [Aliidongia dinghuensis]|uniref:Uncharacterized protein n=1 Tax=Aliidongia dinghuensis TaxID=1867774 RepID=A0A8J2YZL0_9PROT|nr:hypothetical protein [Aliidongia dinghuensis]GGF36148.1 hypothetical protein GCM10011611_48220 [Aliidongia dinghuensis]
MAGEDDNEFTRLNKLMNSDGGGGSRFVAGRDREWTPDGGDAVPAGCQTIHGFYTLSGRQIATTLTVRSNLHFDRQDQERIVRWFFESGELHQSARVTHPPAGYMGYLHDYGRNRIYAVTGIDEAARVVDIPAIGHVNAGDHIF